MDKRLTAYYLSDKELHLKKVEGTFSEIKKKVFGKNVFARCLKLKYFGDESCIADYDIYYDDSFLADDTYEANLGVIGEDPEGTPKLVLKGPVFFLLADEETGDSISLTEKDYNIIRGGIIGKKFNNPSRKRILDNIFK